METLDLLAKLALLTLAWVALSTPMLALLYFIARAMKRRAISHPCGSLAFGVGTALLIAPVPTPIITVFYPHLFAPFFDANVYRWGAWPWLGSSLVMTTVCATLIVARFLRAK